jgi:hypothetical protein
LADTPALILGSQDDVVGLDMFSDIVFAKNPKSADADQFVIFVDAYALVASVEHLLEPAFKGLPGKPGIQYQQQRDNAVDFCAGNNFE